MSSTPIDGELDCLARDYFSLAGRSLPACCLSDEFYSLPRAEEARRHLARADCMDRDRLEDVCRGVESLRAALNRLPDPNQQGIRAGMLLQSMDAFLLHWGVLRFWERDPTLYLKAAWIGLDLALRIPGIGYRERADLYRARLRAAASLLSFGEQQLAGVTDPAREAALKMAGACRSLLREIRCAGLPDPAPTGPGSATGGEPPALPGQEAEQALQALDRFERFVKREAGNGSFCLGRELFEEVLERGLGWTGGLGAAAEVLDEETRQVEADLRALARRIAPGHTWQAVYRRIRLPAAACRDPVALYREEAHKLDTFFRALDLLPMPPRDSVRVEPTPAYLEPVRATASYSAPMLPEAAAQGGRFFVMGLDPGPSGRVRCKTSLPGFEHRDYRYLTAHETVPGHHLLDWYRLHQQDPVRRQVESALFYEGWACYAEQLVDVCGYDPQQVQRLVRLRRNLWRAVRGAVDLGLHTGEMSLEGAAARLEAVGSGPAQARRQARRITLTPGYQLCYTLGKHGFLELGSRFVPPLTLKRFHEIVLSSGQAPFPLLERACCAETGQGEDPPVL